MLNEHLESVELPEDVQIDEIKKIKARVRGGKIQRNVKVATKPGHKIVDGKEVKMKASEKLARAKGAKKGAKKRKGARGGLRARMKSLKLRKRISK